MFRKIILFGLAVTAGLPTMQGAAEPKGPRSGMLDQATLVQTIELAQSRKREALAAVTPDAVLPFQDGGDDVRFTLLRVPAKNSQAVRLHIENMHLAEGSSLFVYGLDHNGQPIDVQGPFEGTGPGHDGALWTTAIRAGQVIVEFQITGEVPADLPFRITELEEANPSEALSTIVESPSRTGEVRVGHFRGMDLSYEVKDGLAIFEGDIVLDRADEMQPAQGKGKSREAVAITGSNYRWPGGVVPYTIDPAIPSPYRVTDAIAHWNTTMAGHIKLVPRSSETAYVHFLNYTSNTCSASVGRRGSLQYVNVGPYCSTGNMIHEIGHAVGLWHEQSREDRNSFITVLWENIISANAFNFNQHITDGDDIAAYDYDSVMHYNAYAFSSNGLPTIATIPAGIPIGQRGGLSTKDVAALRLMYPATVTPPAPTSVTLSFQSNPAGQSIVVDGVTRTAPFSLSFTAGTVHSISAVNATGVGSRTTWSSWSDGGAQTHNVTVPSSSWTLTANFQKSFSVNARSASSLGSVSMTPVSSDTFYPSDSTLALSATAAPGSCFLGWTGLVPGTPSSTSLVVTAPYDITANFGTGEVSMTTTGINFPTFKKQSATLSVSASTGCGWSARSNAGWMSVTQSRTSGSGTVTITTQPNQGAGRLGTVTVGNLTVTVYQAGR